MCTTCNDKAILLNININVEEYEVELVGFIDDYTGELIIQHVWDDSGNLQELNRKNAIEKTTLRHCPSCGRWMH